MIMEKTLEQLMKEHFEFTSKTFPDATATSSLIKLAGDSYKGELLELYNEMCIGDDRGHAIEEYADCFMCLTDSLGRSGIAVSELVEAFAKKLEKNQARTWVKNADNTYSHVKTTTHD